MKNIKFFLFAAIIIICSCNKDKEYDTTVPPTLSHFMNNTINTYYVKNDPNSVFKIPVGVTTNSSSARNVVVGVTSPTNAVSGVQYTVPSTTVTIPANKVIDSLSVKGIFAGFPGSRVDTLTFNITGGDPKPADYNKTFKLVMRKYCDVLLPSFTGAYTRCYDIQPPSPNYGPYTMNCTGVTSLTATTGYMTVTNFWDPGPSSQPIKIYLDWTDPAAFKTTIPAQPLYTDPTYGLATITGVGSGSFSSCDNTFTTSYKVTVAAGSFGNYTTTLAR